ncbi:DUF1996 domain-containing protein [Streptomyces sp. NPDC001046]|uniref:DUF1996 domain-containing protein n=1 Tax=Streptomyces sp. NPDC001046 TaxID=3364543 RepID=UPI0036C6F23A
MKRNVRKRRRPLAVKAVAASAALAIGGGGLLWANFYASAHESGNRAAGADRTKAATARIVTISCPDVSQRLKDVPSAVQGEIARELAGLDRQTTAFYQRLAAASEAQATDPAFVQNSIIGPLQRSRTTVLQRIPVKITQAGGTAPGDLLDLARCTAVPADQKDTGGQQDGGGGQADGGDRQSGVGGQAGNGPTAADFVDITKVRPNIRAKAANGRNASTGTFTTRCGVNANKLYNSDNVIVAPGVTNGAHHTHDYVGNQGIDAFSDNSNFLQGATSCRNKNDRSSYYWPVLRVQDGTKEFDHDQPGGGREGNVGRILTPKQVEIKYVGNRNGKVVPMPQFLRIITGDAKTTTNGLANANANWSCTGFEDRVQLTEQYPLCPRGSNVVRTFAFQSCWDGKNADSANHRTHVAFTDRNGKCANGFKAIPQLTMRLVYKVDRPVIVNGQVKNPYAVDGFPEQLHKPATDHDDFISITTGNLARKIANCVNRGQRCA